MARIKSKKVAKRTYMVFVSCIPKYTICPEVHEEDGAPTGFWRVSDAATGKSRGRFPKKKDAMAEIQQEEDHGNGNLI